MKQPQGKEHKGPPSHLLFMLLHTLAPLSLIVLTLQKCQPGRWYTEGQAQDSILLDVANQVKVVMVTQNQC